MYGKKWLGIWLFLTDFLSLIVINMHKSWKISDKINFFQESLSSLQN